MLDPHAVHIYTDGSCKPNPGGPSGCAARIEYPDHLQRDEELIVDRGYVASTNNRMELMACVLSLRWVRDSHLKKVVGRVQILTDSEYLAKYVAQAPHWKQDNWTNRFGEPRENSDLWNDLLQAQGKAGVIVSYLHMSERESPVLKRTDRNSKAARERGGPYVDGGYRPGSIRRSMLKGVATRFRAAGQSAMVRAYRKSPMKNRSLKIRFDLISDDGLDYVESCFAYASPELTFDLHSANGYRVRFNDDPMHPQIVEILEKVELPKKREETAPPGAPQRRSSG
jgi:ribonuclease HI